MINQNLANTRDAHSAHLAAQDDERSELYLKFRPINKGEEIPSYLLSEREWIRQIGY